MAFSIRRVSAIDFDTAKAVGINYPFSGPAVFLNNFYTKDAIKTSLINYFSTTTGERCLNPQFGSKIRNFLFDQIVDITLADIEDLITEELELNFPTVRVASIVFNGEPDNSKINITIKYDIIQTNISDEINLTIG